MGEQVSENIKCKEPVSKIYDFDGKDLCFSINERHLTSS